MHEVSCPGSQNQEYVCPLISQLNYGHQFQFGIECDYKRTKCLCKFEVNCYSIIMVVLI